MPDPTRRHPVGFAAYVLNETGINRQRFDAAEQLLSAGGVLIDETGREKLGGGRFLLTAQATRAFHTFEAVISNCQIGRGVQAAMLNRALYEDALDVHWVAANPEMAPERADQHDRLVALAEHKWETEFGRTGRELTTDEEVELDALIELYGGEGRAFTASWTRASFRERFDLLKARWGDDEEAEHYLDYLYNVAQRRNNLMLHPSPTAFRQTIVTRGSGKSQLNRIGPDGYWRQALSDGCGGFYLSMRVLAEEFELDKEPAAELFDRTTTLLKPLEQDPAFRDLPPDAECPCGLRRQVGECHGS